MLIEVEVESLEMACAALETGARVAGSDESRVRAVREFGVNLGMAFQLIDDLLDTHGNRDEIGKDTGQDDEKSTLAARLGARHTRGECFTVRQTRTDPKAPIAAREMKSVWERAERLARERLPLLGEKDGSWKPLAITPGAMTVDALSRNIATWKTGKTGWAFLIDEKGFVIAHPIKQYVVKRKNLNSDPLIADFRNRGWTTITTRFKNSKGNPASLNLAEISAASPPCFPKPGISNATFLSA